MTLYVAARLAATAFAAALVIWRGMTGVDFLLLMYGPVSTAAFVARPALRRRPWVWALDSAIALACILAYGDWRSPFYLLWLTTLALPATGVGPRRGLSVGFASSLAYAADAVQRLDRERAERERLAIQAERQRIAWELHDSAKQRIHAAHLLVSSLEGRLSPGAAKTVGRATIELESAASEMDTHLAELRSPLEGRLLHDALRARAAELAPEGRPRISVYGTAPPLSPLVGTHLFRVGSEAITNALRHSGASAIEVTIEADSAHVRLAVRDNGRGLPAVRRPGGHGLLTIEGRVATIDGRLAIGPGADGRGTSIALEVPRHDPGGTA